MKSAAAIAACLTIIGAAACASPTAPTRDAAGETRQNGGMVGSGFDGGGMGSGHDSAPGDTMSTGRYGGMAGSGY